MAVIKSVELKKNGNTASTDQAWKRYYTQTWIVITDSPTVGAGSARNAVPVVIGSPYVAAGESDTGAFCTNVEAKPSAEDGCQWDVTASYGPYDATQFPENPLDRPPEYDWEYERTEEVAEEDANTNPIRNAAGDAFDPPVMQDVRRAILTLVRNEPTFDPDLSWQFHDKCNSGTFWGAGPGIVKVEGIVPKRVFNQMIGWYFTVTYKFLFDRRTHDAKPLNQGMKAVDPSDSTKLVVVTDENGAPLSSPAPLDANGHQLKPTDSPVYLQFQVYERIDFSVFGFDAFYDALTNYQGNNNSFTGI